MYYCIIFTLIGEGAFNLEKIKCEDSVDHHLLLMWYNEFIELEWVYFMKLEIQELGMGLVNAQNDDIILVGGMRSGSSSAGLTRRRYTIYDKVEWIKLDTAGVNEDDIEKACNKGFVDLFVKDNEYATLGVTGLVNIEIKKVHRREGLARKVIDAIRETTGQDLEIHDIKKHVASVWRKLGVTDFHDSHGRTMQVSKVPAFRNLNGTIPALEKALEVKKSPKYESDDGMSL